MPKRHARREDSRNSTVAADALLTAELQFRLADAVHDARRRTARDIQAGVLQRLAAMRIVVSSTLEIRPDAQPAPVMTDIGTGIDAAMVELRATTSVAEPALATSHRLGDALRAATADAPLAVVVRDELHERHPMRVEQAVYFACREATQNAVKHAGRHARVTISLSDARPGIAFCATDDGAGFDRATVHDGVGLLNIKERIESAGGAVTVELASGRGTTVSGFVPDVLAPPVASLAAASYGPLDEHAALRRQILDETDAERHRIVRDLHDGAQQRLVALRVKISLATESAGARSGERGTLMRLAADLDLAIAELRDLARSLRAPLAATAVAPALRRATQHWPMEVRVRERNMRRHEQAVEQAVYGCILEALQEARALRGTRSGAAAVVSLYQAPDAIHFVVRDRVADSSHTRRDHASTGHMLDRAAVVGGFVSVHSLAGLSVVRGSIPIAAGA